MGDLCFIKPLLIKYMRTLLRSFDWRQQIKIAFWNILLDLASRIDNSLLSLESERANFPRKQQL